MYICDKCKDKEALFHVSSYSDSSFKRNMDFDLCKECYLEMVELLEKGGYKICQRRK